MPFHIYILRSESTGKKYVGQTEDLRRRVEQHNDPQTNPTKFTSRNTGPWQLIHSEPYTTRSEAMKREKWLKSGAGRDWIKTT